MRRSNERARQNAVTLSVAIVWCAVLGSLAGCDEIDAHNRVRTGNRMFRDTRFIDAAAEYQKSLTQIDHPVIHYNLGLAYSKVFKAGFDGPILLGTKDEFVCQALPNTKLVEAGACVKDGDRHYAECGSKKTDPLNAAIEKLKKDLADLKVAADAKDPKDPKDEEKRVELQNQLRDKQDELGRYTCSSSFKCVETSFCSLTSPVLAELAAQNFQVWIKAQPSDEDIKKELAAAIAAVDEAKKQDNNAEIAIRQRRVDELQTKDSTRKQMTGLWLDSEQFPKALTYWEGLLKDRPNDTEIMGTLAYINLRAGDWRKSIEWYNKVASVTAEPNSKVAAYQFIGNVAWAKLNSRTLVGADAVELADRGIGALQRASEVQPKNSKVVSLQGAIFNFRSTTHGASWAAAIDRASAQDQAKLARVMAEEAKKAQPAPAAPTPAASAPAMVPAPASTAPATPAAGGAAEKSGG